MLAALLRPLVRHPRALGLQLTIYDPALDPDRRCARRLVDLLHAVLADDVRAPVPVEDADAAVAPHA